MSYTKPESVLLGGAVEAVQTANPKNINTYPEAGQFNGFTVNAYEGDE